MFYKVLHNTLYSIVEKLKGKVCFSYKRTTGESEIHDMASFSTLLNPSSRVDSSIYGLFSFLLMTYFTKNVVSVNVGNNFKETSKYNYPIFQINSAYGHATVRRTEGQEIKNFDSIEYGIQKDSYSCVIWSCMFIYFYCKYDEERTVDVTLFRQFMVKSLLLWDFTGLYMSMQDFSDILEMYEYIKNPWSIEPIKDNEYFADNANPSLFLRRIVDRDKPSILPYYKLLNNEHKKSMKTAWENYINRYTDVF